MSTGSKKQFIILKNGAFLNLSILKKELQWARPLSWNEQIWKPKPGLVDKKGRNSTLFVGQQFDPEFFELDIGAWNHDHCDLCQTLITEGDTSFVADQNIICDSCWNTFIQPKNIEGILEKLPRKNG